MIKITGLSHLLGGRTCTSGGWLDTFLLSHYKNNKIKSIKINKILFISQSEKEKDHNGAKHSTKTDHPTAVKPVQTSVPGDMDDKGESPSILK